MFFDNYFVAVNLINPYVDYIYIGISKCLSNDVTII